MTRNGIKYNLFSTMKSVQLDRDYIDHMMHVYYKRWRMSVGAYEYRS